MGVLPKMPSSEKLIKTYSEMLKFDSFGDRLKYLKLLGIHHEPAHDISNKFYKSREWQALREEIIERDFACELGVPGMFIEGPILVHHINPITEKDLSEWNEYKLLNPDNLISLSMNTHNNIHYGKVAMEPFKERTPEDTKLW